MGIVVVTLVIISTRKKGENIADFSLSPTPTISPEISPTNAPVIKTTSNPKPGIIAQDIKDFNYWFQQLDPQNRVLAVYDECSYMVPSNVAYPNNTQVMLDNTRSEQNHILKIGTKEYALSAKEWQLVTFSSPTLPINMTIFCKNIELGQIELQ